MKILFYLPLITQSGGVERALCTLLNEMSLNNSLEIVLITNYGRREESFFEISDRVRVLDLGIKNYRTKYFKILKDLKTIIQNENADYLVNVETMSMIFTFPFLLNHFKGKMKFLIWEHFNFLNSNGRKLRTLLRKIASKFSDGIITLTNRDVDTWKNNLEIKCKIDSIPNICSFSDDYINNDLNSKTIIAVGRLTQVKGFDRLINIWNDYMMMSTNSDWKLQIIGSGELLTKLSAQIEDLKLNDSIEIIPQTKQIREYYESASFICLTSYNEGLPMVLIEAQFFGLPIVAFDCYTGPSEIVSCKSGILIPDGNCNEFAKAIKLLVDNHCVRYEMGVEAKNESNRYSGSRVVSKWLNYLNQV